MKNNTKKLLSLLLCVMMLASTLAFNAGAVSEDGHGHVHAAEITEEAVKPAALGTGLRAPADADGDVPPSTIAADHEHQWEKKSSYDHTDCEFGETWWFYWECSICHQTVGIAYRPKDPSNWQTGNHHQYVEKVRRTTDCPLHDYVEKVCSVCGNTEIEFGGHKWTKTERVVEGAICTENDKTVWVCECGAEKYEDIIGTSTQHVWDESRTVQTEPSCTEPGTITRYCQVCGYQAGPTANKPALGHTWKPDGEGTSYTCSVCGAQQEGDKHEHIWAGNWRSDETSHWEVCVECGAIGAKSAHVGTDKCLMCGHAMSTPNLPSGWGGSGSGSTGSTGCQHDYSIVSSIPNDPMNHMVTCSLCGDSYRESCSSMNHVQPRTSCTDPVYCACGRKISDGQKSHNFFRGWEDKGDYHVKKCQNMGGTCSGEQIQPHTFTVVGTVLVCTACGARTAPTATNHTHNYGAPVSNGDGTHTRTCVIQGCTASQTDNCVAGTSATCVEKAHCSVCGGAFGTTDSSNHVGGTVVRDAKAAQVGVPGYTGDTYCLGCDQKIAEGSEIPALTKEHVHAYTIAKHDATGHWNECECGQKQGFAAHTGGTATCVQQAVCSVCGESYGALDATHHVGGTEIRNAKAAQVGVAGYTGDTHCLGCGALLKAGEEIAALQEDHEHVYTLMLDSLHHWQECECGDKKDIEEHTYVDDRCSVCGDDKPEEVEVHIHSFASTYSSDSTSHWLECTSCGARTDVDTHMFVDGTCVTCGMTTQKHDVEEAKEKAKADVQGENSVLKVFEDMTDVQPDAYFVVPIQMLYNAGIMGGTDTGFDLNGSFTRIQVMTVLARISGQKDVSADWNTNKAAYLQWAEETDIAVDGSEDIAASREETVYMIWALAGKPTSTTDLSQFADFDAVDSDYEMAVRWAVEKGILTGSQEADGMLHINPDSSIMRKDAAALVTRYIDAEEVAF